LIGLENFTDDEAKAMTAEDPDFHRRDLFNAIATGNAPEWQLQMQVMPFEAAADYRFNPFDLTKVWPHEDFKPIVVGRMVLDRNPENFFAEVEQAGFSPANLVPGTRIKPGQDADGTHLLVSRRASPPHGTQPRATPYQRSRSRGSLQ
jgi:catalase